MKKIKKELKVTFQFAVVYEDEYGQTISLFKIERQAEEYYKAIKK